MSLHDLFYPTLLFCIFFLSIIHSSLSAICLSQLMAKLLGLQNTYNSLIITTIKYGGKTPACIANVIHIYCMCQRTSIMQLAFNVLYPKISVFVFCSEGLISFHLAEGSTVTTGYCVIKGNLQFFSPFTLFQFIGYSNKLVLCHQCFLTVLNTYEIL